jgi:hypothetical protein
MSRLQALFVVLRFGQLLLVTPHMSDIVWRDTAGDIGIWLMNGATVLSAGGLGNVPTTWSIVQTGDYNGDGMSDLLWRDTSGNTAMWFMNGTTVASTAGVGNIPTNWTVQSVNAEQVTTVRRGSRQRHCNL